MSLEPVEDVVVVGSGPAGVAAATALIETGARVLLLDASSAPIAPPAQYASIGARRLGQGEWRDHPDCEVVHDQVSPKLATRRAQTVLAGFTESLGVTSDGFMPVGSLAAGGLSQIWGALAHPYEGADLAGFPDRAGFAASLARVRARIGIGVPDEHGDSFAAHLTEPVRRLFAQDRNGRHRDGVSLSLASNAVLSQTRGDRQACNGCGQCLHGCARGAIYNSAFELLALHRHPLVTYRAGHRVVALHGSEPDFRIETRCAALPGVVRARRVVLAAGTLATTALAVRHLGMQGRSIRLLSNPVGGAAFLVPSLVGRDLPERSFALGQLSYRLALDGGTAEMFGVLYGADTLPLAPIADRLPFTRATSLRLARALAPALVLASGYLPGRLSDNSIRVDGDAESGSVHVAGSQTEQARRCLKEGFARLARYMRGRGAWMLPGSITVLPPGADAHPAGTLPLGDPGVLGTSAFGELNGSPGLFIADGASLPQLAAVHPTLTIMANADRIGLHVGLACRRERSYARAC